MEALFELIELALFLVKVLDKSPSSLLHLMKSTFKSLDDADHGSIRLPPILRMPNVVGDELLNSPLPLILKHDLIIHYLKLIHKSVDILNQDVVAGDKNLLLLSGLLLLGHRSRLLSSELVGRLVSITSHRSSLLIVPLILLRCFTIKAHRFLSIFVTCRLDHPLAAI